MAASRQVSARKLWRHLLTMAASFIVSVAIERLRQQLDGSGDPRPLASYTALFKLHSCEHACKGPSFLEGERHYSQQARRAHIYLRIANAQRIVESIHSLNLSTHIITASTQRQQFLSRRTRNIQMA